MTFGSLFAGIGGFDLGFERAGMTCAWQVEINEFCRQVLAKHWPDVRRWDDVRTFPPEPIEQWRVDVICGGFPCQDISFAGAGAGLSGKRSGLWTEYIRVIRAIRPTIVIVENVAALLDRGMGRVLGDLAESGFNAEWDCIPASAVGADHQRDRVFLLANSLCERRILTQDSTASERGKLWQADNFWRKERHNWNRQTRRLRMDSVRRAAELGIRPMVDGLPTELDERRIHGLGNSVVPQVAEWIGRKIIESKETNLHTKGT